ncbi:hypothetical protein [Paraburkholderia haematera]|nr:hypothetical protein [Paraburkholderia haematera]
MTVADADAADLRTLIAVVQPRLKEADQVRDRAAQAVRGAEQEDAVHALDKRIVEIEEKLCAAVAERFRLGCEHDSSVYACVLPRHCRPTESLHRAVVEGAVPALNGTSVPAVSQAVVAK